MLNHNDKILWKQAQSTWKSVVALKFIEQLKSTGIKEMACFEGNQLHGDDFDAAMDMIEYGILQNNEDV